jgi:hypothetical protein
MSSAKGIYDHLRDLKELLKSARKPEDVKVQALALIKNIKGGFGDLRQLPFGALGIASSLMSIDASLQRAQASPNNLGLQLQVVTNIASLVGSVLCMVPALAPLGAMISTCAGAINILLGFVIGDPEGDARRADEREALERSDVLGDKDVAEAVTKPNAAANLAAAQEGGMTMDEINALARSRPWVFEKHDFVDPLNALRTWLGRHPEIGHYTRETPSLNAFLTELDQRTLEDLNGFATPYVNQMNEDRPFGRGEELFVANTAADYLEYYVFGSS